MVLPGAGPTRRRDGDGVRSVTRAALTAMPNVARNPRIPRISPPYRTKYPVTSKMTWAVGPRVAAA